jgi:hypothetical protein
MSTYLNKIINFSCMSTHLNKTINFNCMSNYLNKSFGDFSWVHCKKNHTWS